MYLAICNLLQVMYKTYPDQEGRVTSVTAASRKVPKSGPAVLHKKFCDVLNRMIS